MLKIIFIASLFVISSCSNNTIAKDYGGSITIDLPANQKLETATWKDADFWYLTRPMRKDEVAEIHSFHENATFGVLQGTVIIREHQ